MKNTTASAKPYGTPSIGCYLDQSYCNACEHDARTIRLAADYGYEIDDETRKLLARCDCDVLSDDRDDAQTLSETADEACEFLNGLETRSYLYWGNNGEAGAFGLWANVESAEEDCEKFADGSEVPADFTGEWLQVSDHGNVSLYVRDESGKDSEVWGIV